MKRRDFLKLTGGIGTAVALYPGFLFPRDEPRDGANPVNVQYLEEQFEEFGCPYDYRHFDSSQRVFFPRKDRGIVSVLPKEGKQLEVELYLGPGEKELRICGYKANTGSVVAEDATDIPFYIFGTPLSHEKEIKYQLKYRELGEKKWNWTPPAVVKTPFVDLKKGDVVEIIVVGDNHASSGDADQGSRIVEDRELRTQRLDGKIFDRYGRKLWKNSNNPYYKPEPGSEEAKCLTSWSIAATNIYIARNENPHAVIDGGDTNTLGFFHKWPGLGLKPRGEASTEEKKLYSKIFHKAQRKKYSPVSFFTDTRLCLGNHDAEQGFNNNDGLRDISVADRKKYWRQPDSDYFWQASPEENYYAMFFGPNSHTMIPVDGMIRDDVMLLILDSEGYLPYHPVHPEDYTLGMDQNLFVKNYAEMSRGVKYKLSVQHRMIGGGPGGPGGEFDRGAYARYNMVLPEDFQELNDKFGKEFGFYINPDQVEQVQLTKLLMDNGFNAIIYNHDHMFNNRTVEKYGKKINVICAGATKHNGNINWWLGDPLWEHFYGDFGRFYNEEKLGDDPRLTNPRKPDFWGPSGIAKITISESGIRVRNIRSAYNHPETNISPNKFPGDVLYSAKL